VLDFISKIAANIVLKLKGRRRSDSAESLIYAPQKQS
jgi:rare lipoprotein A